MVTTGFIAAVVAPSGTSWWALPAGALVLLCVLWLRANWDRGGVNGSLEQVASRIDGHFRAGGIFSRPSVSGMYEEAELRLTFPTRFLHNSVQQQVGIRFRTADARPTTIKRIEPSHDLLGAGVMTPERLSEDQMTQRLDYIFRQLEGSDLIISDGWAHMTIAWPYNAAALSPDALFEPIEQVFLLVRLIAGERSGLPVKVDPFGG